MRILIVSVFFPPKNSIASQRPYSWAKHLSRLGHDVTVLTTRKTGQSDGIFSPPEKFNLIEVPVPGMEFLSRLLDMPRHLPSDAKQVRQGYLKSFMGWLVRYFRKLQQSYGVMYACRMPEIHDLWVIPAYYRIPPGNWDLVVTTAWPYSVHFIGWMLKKRHRAKRWVVDWRDLWTDNHMYPGLPLIRNIERWLEKKFNSAADIVTTVSSPLAGSLANGCGDKVKVIYNGFDEEDYAALPKQNIFADDNKIRIVYTGSLYPGKRDPSPLFQAIAYLARSGSLLPGQLEVIFASKLLDVAALAEQFGISDYVSSVGFLPREQALRMQRDADALLFLEFDAPGVEGILTGKLFEYLHAGPPIVAVGISQESTAGTLICASGRGCALGNDIVRIQAWLEYLINNHATPPLPPGKLDIGIYSRAQQAARLLELANSAHSQPTQSPT